MKQQFIQMFEEEQRQHGELSLCPFCVGVITAIVAAPDRSPEIALDEIKQALEAFEIVRGEA